MYLWLMSKEHGTARHGTGWHGMVRPGQARPGTTRSNCPNGLKKMESKKRPKAFAAQPSTQTDDYTRRAAGYLTANTIHSKSTKSRNIARNVYEIEVCVLGTRKAQLNKSNFYFTFTCVCACVCACVCVCFVCAVS